MAEQKQKKVTRNWDSINDAIDDTLPSDQDLQRQKADRRNTADEVTDYLAQKGFPTLGAVAGTVTDLSADIMPSSRDEYMENIGTGSMGSVSKVGKLGRMAMPESKVMSEGAKQEARTAWNSLKGAAKDEWGNDFEAFAKAMFSEGSEAPAQVVKKAPTPYEFPKSVEKRTRLMTDDRHMGVQKMVDPATPPRPSNAGPQASTLAEPPVQPVKFRTHEGLSFQEEQALKAKNKEADSLLSRIKSPVSKK